MDAWNKIGITRARKVAHRMAAEVSLRVLPRPLMAPTSQRKAVHVAAEREAAVKPNPNHMMWPVLGSGLDYNRRVTGRTNPQAGIISLFGNCRSEMNADYLGLKLRLLRLAQGRIRVRSCSYWDIHLERHNAQESLLICIAKGTALQSKIMQWDGE